MAFGFLLLLLAGLLNVGGFFGLRYVVARRWGARGILVTLGLDHRPWLGAPFRRRLLFACLGPAACYLVAASFAGVGVLIGGKDIPDESSMRVVVMSGSPAAEAGLRDGDRVVAVSDVPVGDWTALRRAVHEHAHEETRITVQRDGRDVVLRATPDAHGRIGVMAPVEHERVGLFAALGIGLIEPLRVSAAMIRGLADILRGRQKVEAVGPVGIVRVTADAAFANALRFVGGLNAYLLWLPTLLSLLLFPRRGKVARA